MQSFGELFANNRLLALVLLFAVAVVLAAVALVGYRLMFGRRLSMSGAGRTRQPRLGVVDAFDLDRHRQLVLVRRDNTEHLIMIGGPNDLVIETSIVRAAPSPSREKETGSTTAPGLTLPPFVVPGPPPSASPLSPGMVPTLQVPRVQPSLPANPPAGSQPAIEVSVSSVAPAVTLAPSEGTQAALQAPHPLREQPQPSPAAPRTPAAPSVARPAAPPPVRQPPAPAGANPVPVPKAPTPSPRAPAPPTSIPAPVRPLTTPTRATPVPPRPQPNRTSGDLAPPDPTDRIQPPPAPKPDAAAPVKETPPRQEPPAPAAGPLPTTVPAPTKGRFESDRKETATARPGEAGAPASARPQMPVPPPQPPIAPARTQAPAVRSIEALESLEEEMAKLLGRPIPPPDKS